MNREELVAALKQIGPETGSLCCLGCGYEHGCSVHGCAVIRAAVAEIKALQAPPPNPPLTLEELREMIGGPAVWIVTIGVNEEYYALITSVDDENVYMLSTMRPNDYGSIGLYGDAWLAYRRKPEEGTT